MAKWEKALTFSLSMQLPYLMDASIQKISHSWRRNRERRKREDTSDMRMEKFRNTGTQRDEIPIW